MHLDFNFVLYYIFLLVWLYQLGHLSFLQYNKKNTNLSYL